MSHADHLLHRLRTRPADLDDAERKKADERYSASADFERVWHIVLAYVSAVILAVLIPALVLRITWVDVLTWLTEAADAIARLL